MKAAELKDLTTEELESKLIEFKDKLFSLRFQVVTGQVKNTAQLTAIKKDVARVNTILKQRENNEAVKAGGIE